jgi:hypothetical protein
LSIVGQPVFSTVASAALRTKRSFTRSDLGVSHEALEQFHTIVLNDRSLQKQLGDLTDIDEFTKRVIELGLECGCEFSPAEIEDKINANRRRWIERWI